MSDEPAYTPRAEYSCKNSTTHYQGCECHESRWKERVAELEECLRQSQHASKLAMQQVREQSERVAQLKTEVSQLEVQVKNPGASFCAYCQFQFDGRETEEQRLIIANHSMDCEKSPLRYCLARWEATSALVEELMDALADNVHPKNCTADEDGDRCNHCRAFALMDRVEADLKSTGQKAEEK